MLTPSACYNLIGALPWLSPCLPIVRDCGGEVRDGRGLRKSKERRGRRKKREVESERESEKAASQATPALIHVVPAPPGARWSGVWWNPLAIGREKGCRDNVTL